MNKEIYQIKKVLFDLIMHKYALEATIETVFSKRLHDTYKETFRHLCEKFDGHDPVEFLEYNTNGDSNEKV